MRTGAASEGRRAPDPWDVGFGAAFALFALAALFVWFPADIRGPFIDENFSGRPEPGDAFFPVLLAAGILALSLVQVAVALAGRRRDGADAAPAPRLDRGDLVFLAGFHAIVFASLALMAFLGPLLVSALGAAGLMDARYRQLVDTAPWKYVGYLAGGFAMTFALVTWAQGRPRLRPALAIALVLVVLAFVFDVLLRNVQIPPNADV